VNEDIVALLTRDEAVTLFGVEELDRALCHLRSFRNAAGRRVRPCSR
jgi:hypothetical protein